MPTTLNPYLMFDHNCRAAMEFYHSCLGGELKISSYGESGAPCPDDQKEDIIHAHLENGPIVIMASDWNHTVKGYVRGTNVHLSLVGTDEQALRDAFGKLSAGGTVKMSLDKQMWGDIYGMFTDKFGIEWMVNINMPK